MTPLQMLRYFGESRGLDRALLKRRLTEVVERCEVDDLLERRIATLSKGQRLRVGLAQALLHDPRVLLVDEPSSGFEPGLRRQFYEQLRQIRGNRTILVAATAAHDLDPLVDRVLMIRSGRLLFDGTPAQLKDNAAIELPAYRVTRDTGSVS